MTWGIEAGKLARHLFGAFGCISHLHQPIRTFMFYGRASTLMDVKFWAELPVRLDWAARHSNDIQCQQPSRCCPRHHQLLPFLFQLFSKTCAKLSWRTTWPPSSTWPTGERAGGLQTDYYWCIINPLHFIKIIFTFYFCNLRQTSLLTPT